MDFDFRGNTVGLLPDEFCHGFGTVFSQCDCFIRYGSGNKTCSAGKSISRVKRQIKIIVKVMGIQLGGQIYDEKNSSNVFDICIAFFFCGLFR